ncbi:putative serine/threonine protein kinase [Streptomyces bingchenggensis BCW-1]|uniref:non-specific serine/threonine protein kinase n=2 Tax=Streptomyces TaxID=1883 RepID=D7CCH7_STRBB|nr:putative serine/threonine protein kinase [Streptomyces bingchenggensis BCW-1]
MGEVWRATDEVLRRTVAVKLLLGDDPASQAAARFRLEAQTAARLSHPNIVGVFDFGARDGRFYLVMELVEGQSLAQELTAQGALRAERVAAIAAQGAAGLASAHRTGIVHRDIKPGNLMSDADGTVKIGDFGIARFVDDPATALTTAGQIIGTSLYLAPERALGRPASPASDVYSLGCLLYQLLTGTPPFQADTSAATLAQHIDAAPVPPSQRGAGLPPAFENYLLGMLAKQPEERPTAQHIADWFGSGAWQGRPEPMPQPAPAPAPAPAPMPGPPPHAQAFGTATPQTPPAAAPAAGPPRAPETPSVATYRLPQPAPARRPARGHRSTSASPSASTPAPASAPAKRRGARELIRRRPRVASLIAGAVAFIAAVLIGIAWFSS